MGPMLAPWTLLSGMSMPETQAKEMIMNDEGHENSVHLLLTLRTVMPHEHHRFSDQLQLDFCSTTCSAIKLTQSYCLFVRRIHCDQWILLTKSQWCRIFSCHDVVIEMILSKHLEIGPALDITTFCTIGSNFDHSSFCDTQIDSMNTKYLHRFKIMLVILVSF